MKKPISFMRNQPFCLLYSFYAFGHVSSKGVMFLLVKCLGEEGTKGGWKDAASGLIDDLGYDE